MNTRSLAINLLNFFTSLVEGFLALRFATKLMGANPNNGFIAWLYEMSGVLLDPFQGIFPATVFENRFVNEFSTLFAMLIYAIIAVLIVTPIDTVTPSKKVFSQIIVGDKRM